jgi:hypothetical protein
MSADSQRDASACWASGSYLARQRHGTRTADRHPDVPLDHAFGYAWRACGWRRRPAGTPLLFCRSDNRACDGVADFLDRLNPACRAGADNSGRDALLCRIRRLLQAPEKPGDCVPRAAIYRDAWRPAGESRSVASGERGMIDFITDQKPASVTAPSSDRPRERTSRANQSDLDVALQHGRPRA